MIVLVQRTAETRDSTLGMLYFGDVDYGDLFRCFTLEDGYRIPKVRGETRIPPGDYRCTLRTDGGMHEKYSREFATIHRGMLWLRNVPGFQWIYLHCGNEVDDTEGCILVGAQASIPGIENRFRIMGSREAYRAIYSPLADAAERDSLLVRVRDIP